MRFNKKKKKEADVVNGQSDTFSPPLHSLTFPHIHDIAILVPNRMVVRSTRLVLTVLRVSSDYCLNKIATFSRKFHTLSREIKLFRFFFLAPLIFPQMPKQKAQKKQLKSYKLKHINRTIQGNLLIFFLNFFISKNCNNSKKRIVRYGFLDLKREMRC